MTEKTAKRNNFNWINRARKPGYLIDPVAFFIALICGPLLFTLTTFWILLIPLFALFFGGPVYLVIGTPLLLLYLRYFKGDIGGLALLGLGANIALLAILFLVAELAPHARNIHRYINVASFGLIFAPLWAASFGHLYLKLRKPFYACAHRY